MELTGKAKKDFKKWLWADIDLNNDTNIILATIKYGFKDFPFSMQYGVYVDWFDSTGIAIVGLPYQLIINEGSIQRCKIDFGGFNRVEGRELAIKKSNEIYNKS